MDIILIKIVSAFLFFLTALCFGWLPFCLYQRFVSSPEHDKGYKSHNGGGAGDRNRGGHGIVHSLHSLASGVLIATCLLHLLPESLEAVRKGLGRSCVEIPSPQNTVGNVFLTYNHSSSPLDGALELENVKENDREEEADIYPVAECLMAMGFIFVYVFESTVKAIKEAKSNANNRNKLRSWEMNDNYQYYASDSSSEMEWDGCSNMEETQELVRHSSTVNENAAPAGNKHSHSHDKHKEGGGEFIPSCKCKVCHHCKCGHNSRELQHREPGCSNSITKSSSSSSSSSTSHPEDIRSMALVMALCVHGFFDGVMLGLQTSDTTILTLMFALSLHKSFVALSLSLTLAKIYSESGSKLPKTRHNIISPLQSKTRYFLYVLAFALMAPLGLVGSTALIHSRLTSPGDAEESLVPGCLQSFAVGTFLYITFTETTSRHHESSRNSTVWAEVRGHVSLIAGFTLIAGLRAVFGST